MLDILKLFQAYSVPFKPIDLSNWKRALIEFISLFCTEDTIWNLSKVYWIDCSKFIGGKDATSLKAMKEFSRINWFVKPLIMLADKIYAWKSGSRFRVIMDLHNKI